VKIISNKNKIIEINFISEAASKEIAPAKVFSKKFPENLPAEVENLKNQLTEYLQSKRQEFQIDYRISGTAFQQKILKETVRIPYGQTVSYKELAEKAGSPRAWQAAGQALKNNKLPVIIPCHRVVGTRGYGGYNGGLKIKKILLKLEGSL
ncbi:MAG: methylated-DNA--[protein]-cysteine S-methyltransferase, partial [Halarsenatibacteraceae bacterium]